jgi:hypothetical protein
VPEKREAASVPTEVTSARGDTKVARSQRLKAYLATGVRRVFDHPWAFMNGQMVGGFYAASRFIDSDVWTEKRP